MVKASASDWIVQEPGEGSAEFPRRGKGEGDALWRHQASSSLESSLRRGQQSVRKKGTSKKDTERGVNQNQWRLCALPGSGEEPDQMVEAIFSRKQSIIKGGVEGLRKQGQVRLNSNM